MSALHGSEAENQVERPIIVGLGLSLNFRPSTVCGAQLRKNLRGGSVFGSLPSCHPEPFRISRDVTGPGRTASDPAMCITPEVLALQMGQAERLGKQ